MQAFGSLHSVINVKYSSPIFLISNRPAPVPTSSSLSSSGRLTILAPQALLGRGSEGNQMISGIFKIHFLSLKSLWLGNGAKVDC